MRLAQYIALTGLCSRRAAARLIREGKITIDGRRANHIDSITTIETRQGMEVVQKICVEDRPIKPIEAKQYWILNKRVGTDCRLLANEPSSLIHLLPAQPRLYPVGRLDKDSHGLLLLTNDGNLTQRLLHPDYQHTKRYEVRLDRPFDDSFLHQMANGVNYKSVITLPCHTRRLGADRFEIILTQGLNRQIRRMSQALGYKVIDLKRIAIATLQLGELPKGELRPLTGDELAALTASIE